MVLLCFVLDLRSLSPSILRDLKQALFQLANYYAGMFRKANRSFDEPRSQTKQPLLDQIGLCYVFRNRASCVDELKIAYNPHGTFNLRDLHHALNNLPNDAFSPQSHDSGPLYLKLAEFLSEKNVYSWGDQDKSVWRKVILITSCSVGTMDSTTIKALMDAGEKCVLVEFILLEQTSSHLGDLSENLHVLYGLAKRWFLELRGDKEELQAHFVFKETLFSNLNWMSCKLQASSHPIVDEFEICQACRCHGIPLDCSNTSQMKLSCPVNRDELGALDIFENSIRVGEQTILYMPSFQGGPKQNQLSSPIEFHVIQRTNLRSLSEGLLSGGTYFVTPSAFQDNVENDKAELSRLLFQVVCDILNSLDQGLVCASNCNIETACVTSFRCYYILLPSDKGLMLLRRLSSSEEFLPIPNISQLTSSVTVEEVENTVQASLLKVENSTFSTKYSPFTSPEIRSLFQMEVSEYNPFEYERGFHRKLNLLVKESLQFGAIHPKSKKGTTESDVDRCISEVQPTVPAESPVVTGDELPQLETQVGDKRTGSSLAEEWEQLIVTELGGIRSPICISNSKHDQLVASPSQINRQLDEKTSRILERLEVPRQLKRKTASPTTSSSLSVEAYASLKKPLIPYLSNDTADQVIASSQPMKPSFQRIKKKR